MSDGGTPDTGCGTPFQPVPSNLTTEPRRLRLPGLLNLSSMKTLDCM